MQVLDRQRLGKQRVEVLQLLKALTDPTAKGWVNHPCTKMWKGYEAGLGFYGLACCDEWITRGYRDTCRGKIWEMIKDHPDSKMPSWLGDEQFHLSHQSNLIRKDPEFYRPIFGADVPDNLPYIWPIPT